VMMLDVRGLSCPIPVLKVSDALTSCTELEVWVDDPVARQNILKFAASQGCGVVESTINKYESKLRIKKG
jgi:tRNA 2-thiouridine synthesizing protein A